MGSEESHGVGRLGIDTNKGAGRVDRVQSAEEDATEHGIRVQVGDDIPHMSADSPHVIGSSTEARAGWTTVIGLAKRTRIQCRVTHRVYCIYPLHPTVRRSITVPIQQVEGQAMASSIGHANVNRE